MGLPVCRVCGIIVYVREQILYFRLIFPQLNRWYVDFLLQNDILIAKERWIDVDQIKIGKFISERRRAAGLTQAELAEKLGITDRAVSKWETGRSLPDSAIMLDLCAMLSITVTDLLCGEVVSMENYNKELEKQLIELKAQKEEAAPAADDEFTAEILRLIDERAAAKKAKNFAEADRIRNYLLEKGVTLIDSREGTTFKIN